MSARRTTTTSAISALALGATAVEAAAASPRLLGSALSDTLADALSHGTLLVVLGGSLLLYVALRRFVK